MIIDKPNGHQNLKTQKKFKWEITKALYNITKFSWCPPKSIKHLVNNSMEKSKDTI
jgi:hypothetical protein